MERPERLPPRVAVPLQEAIVSREDLTKVEATAMTLMGTLDRLPHQRLRPRILEDRQRLMNHFRHVFLRTGGIRVIDPVREHTLT